MGSSFYQQDHPQKTPTVQKRAANYAQPGSRNKFQELLEADAVARAAMEASKRPSSVASAEDTRPQPSVDSGRQHAGTGKDEFTFAISVLGNRIKLSVTPKRP
jgi:ribonuclease I